MTRGQRCFKDHSLEALRERFAVEGLARYRAEQVAGWVYRKGIEDPGAMTDLGRELRERLKTEWRFRALELEAVERSRDATLKAVLRAVDGARIESVAIPEAGRLTLCVSSQVGCPLGCRFCATGAMGFVRNLRTGEIVDQLCRMRERLGAERPITHVVFMGMGEPLLNFPSVAEAIRLLVHPKAFGFAPRRITVSTVGIVPKLRPLLEVAPVQLAVSLHAADDALRERLLPIARRYPLEQLLEALRTLGGLRRRRPVFFEVTLIEGVNDAPELARLLVRRVRGIPCKINVIPMNPHPASPFRPPSAERVDRFVAELVRGGLTVTLRRSRGADIGAACGQLALRGAPGVRAAGAGGVS